VAEAGTVTIGSTWRRWDLHVHTPASIVNHYGGNDAWDRFLDELSSLPPEMSVLGINDYLFVDGYRRVLSEWRQGRLPNLEAIFPVVEFRLQQLAGVDGDLGRINYHVIFAPGLDPDLIDAQFLHGLAAKFQLSTADGPPWSGFLSRDNLASFGAAVREQLPPERRSQHSESDLALGFNNLAVPLSELRELMAHTAIDGQAICAIGKAEWSDFRWTDQSIASKKDLINSAEIVFTAAASAAAYQKSRRSLIDQQVNDRLLDCSDAHHYGSSGEKDRLGNCFTWLRAQPTLDGLKHALTEFDHRVFVGDEPPKLSALRSRPSDYIQEVQITRASDAPPDALVLFDTKLRLNPGFVAVVGNKGKGKSALLDVIGLAADSSAESNFTFLSAERFRNPRANRAAEHAVALTWWDGDQRSCRLDKPVTSGAPQRVTYLPQRLLDEICSADPGEPAEKFAHQLGQVLFAHVPSSDRLGASTLDELIEKRSQAVDERLQALRGELGTLNRQIAETERRLRPERRSAVEQRLTLLRQKLETLRDTEPSVSQKPDDAADPTQTARVEELSAGVAQCDTEINNVHTEDARLALELDAGEQLRTALETLVQSFVTFQEAHRAQANQLGLRLEDLVQLNVSRTPLDAALEQRTIRRDELRGLLDTSSASGPVARREALQADLTEAIQLLDQPSREYTASVARHEVWARACAELEQGSTEEPGINPTEAELAGLQRAPEALAALQTERRSLVLGIHGALRQKVQIFEDLYRPARDFIDGHPLARACDLTFGASLRERNLEQRFFDLLSRAIGGTFTGIEDGSEELHSRMSSTDFSSSDDVEAFVEDLDRALHEDRRAKPATRIDPERAVRTGHSLEEIYDLVFGLSYLEPHHSLRYQGVSIDQLSPGEKGTLLLMFYLLVDPARTPLLLDQPDENLDNHTIKDLLVPAIKEAAARRQVIVVTHNPNVAIVADADQIVVASRDSDEFVYQSGAIEDGPINLNAVDVLEGTWPALDNRNLKYQRP
jgi:ABC-type lipoprotein export system ATPase subunit